MIRQNCSRRFLCRFSQPSFGQRYRLEVQRTRYRSYVTGSIHSWGRSRLTYVPGDCWLKERKLTWQRPSVTVGFSVQYDFKISSVIHLFILNLLQRLITTKNVSKLRANCPLPLSSPQNNVSGRNHLQMVVVECTEK